MAHRTENVAAIRVLRAKEGKLASGAVSDADRDRDERWQNTSGNGALSPTGNWDRRRLDLNGDGDYTDAGEIDDTGTFNKANEWLTRDTTSGGTPNMTLTHDAVGNLTNDGKDYTYKYDAFGRLVEVKNRATAALVAEYRYNGLNFRIGWHYDADADGTVETGTPGDDPWYWFAHDERWRIVATYRDTDTNAKERFVWHSAGLDGNGGSSYIDSVILRDKDANTAWTTASDGTLEERLYYAQNWRADVSLVLSSTGQLKERIKYSAYGVPFCISPADYNGDAAVDQFDYLDFMADYDVENVRADINFDGTTDFYDYLDYIAEYDSGNGESGGGRSSLSRASIGNRIGYAGYQWDPSIRGSITGAGGASAGKYHVRHRVLDAGQGRWTRRDALGYVDGASVYEYVRSAPVRRMDPRGLKSIPCPMGEANCGGSGSPPVNPPGGPPAIDPLPGPYPWLQWCLARCDANFEPGFDRAKCRNDCRRQDESPEKAACCAIACVQRSGSGRNYCCSGKLYACTCPDNLLPPRNSIRYKDIPEPYGSQFMNCVANQEDCVTPMFTCSNGLPFDEAQPIYDECRTRMLKCACLRDALTCLSSIECHSDIICEAYKSRFIEEMQAVISLYCVACE